MKKRFAFLLSSIIYLSNVNAQCFQTTITNIGNTIIFKIRPTGGDITTGFSAMEYFIRYPDTKVITWGTVTPNTAQFPALQISKETPSLIATETGSTIVRFYQTLLTNTTSATYTNGTEYEVFRITASGSGTVDLELVHLDTYLKYWSTMTALDAVTERTCPIKFYGTGATATAASFQSFFLNNVVVPIDLLNFSGREEDESIRLNWQTVNERDVNHFVLEKSIDNTGKFTMIGEVKAAGHSATPQYYSLLDVHPSRLNYYRLKTVDNDGGFEYSKTLTFIGKNKEKDKIAFYPNPATNVLNVELSHKDYHKATVSLSDMTGRILLTQTKNSDTAGNSPFIFNTQDLQNGIFTAIVTIDGHKSMFKVVIAK